MVGRVITVFRCLLLLPVLLVWSCSELKDELPITPQDTRLTFQRDIHPILLEKCASCHDASATIEGNYDVTSIIGIMGTGTDDIANVLSGDASSLLLASIEPGGSMAQYASSADVQKIRTWIVNERLYLGSPAVHPDGYVDPASPDFHGIAVRQNGWDIGACAGCHGEDYAGSTYAPSCETCHALKGSSSCITCHGGMANRSGAPPADIQGNTSLSAKGVGAHTSHVTGTRLTINIQCAQCHVVPDSVNAVGHMDTDLPAEVAFSGIAAARGAAPQWNSANLTCDNLYCHGAFPAGNDDKPQWTDVGDNRVVCGTCHSVPPQGKTASGFEHTGEFANCSICHPTVNANRAIVRKDLHINGDIDIGFGQASYHATGILDPGSANWHGTLVRNAGWNLNTCKNCHGTDYAGGWTGKSCNSCHEDTPEGCTVCHGGVDNNTGAPPKDLAGNTATRNVTVGAHTSHVNGSKFTNNLTCEQCHIVPGVFDAEGHIGTDERAELNFSGLALEQGAAPEWNREKATCSETYCHGSFSAGSHKEVIWTRVGRTEAECGTCHGLPPTTPGRNFGFVHPAGIRNCELCHGDVIERGFIIKNKDLHMNGTVEQNAP